MPSVQNRSPHQREPQSQDGREAFIRVFQALCDGRHSPHKLWSDWLEITSIFAHQIPYIAGELSKDSDFERLEAQYLERITQYNKTQHDLFSQLLGILLREVTLPTQDFLGQIYGELDLHKKQSGQFFTPYPIARVIAEGNLQNATQEIAASGILTIDEPAVGSGCCLIAIAETIARQGFDPRAHLQMQCTDVDRDCFNMAYIQLSLLGLQAIVRHGNTLSQEIWESRPTPQIRYFWQWLEASGWKSAYMMWEIIQQMRQENNQAKSEIETESQSLQPLLAPAIEFTAAPQISPTLSVEIVNAFQSQQLSLFD